MPEFLPFVGTRYDSSKVTLANVTSPPYDVISDELRDVLYARDEHNVVRLEFSREPDPYASAYQLLRQWEQQGILRREANPGYYVYRQIFHAPGIDASGGSAPRISEMTRTGVIGRLRLSPYDAKEIIPHERTHAGPKQDRMRLMEATRANFSPIFGLISDPSFVFDQTLEIATVQPAIANLEEELPDGRTIRHLLWRLDDQGAIERIARIVGSQSVVIADGHHRYETALEYQGRHPEIPQAGYIMSYVSNLQSQGTVILPTHRLLHDAPNFNQYRLLESLKERFELVPVNTREEGIALLDRDDQAISLLEFSEVPRFVLLRDNIPPARDVTSSVLPVSRIEKEIFREIIGLSDDAIARRTNLFYPHTMAELDEMKESAPWDVAFLVRAVNPEQVMAIVHHGEFMPQKTTYFYPKLLTGLVIHEFEAQEGASLGSQARKSVYL
ncbi:MAG: DUF1015 domain-containing protein [Bacteroidota bacterium]|nr:DUF1015 domain-containing protein [Bacteroidota bacterium]MDP4233776.1 DUF1015 domain-containing protein [Bacteroidota bacterium]MDP4242415.1 DUF1015 domain-containing protein [Bacteroidota bacterium]MDP4287537.1 DUF1015 domain-containing protein [Bacteroidota bacterium]